MLEHSPQLNITQPELNPIVSDYFDNLLAQRDAILATYKLTPETAEQFCDVRSTDHDRESILALYERMVYVIENKQIPPSEPLEQERIQEQQRINAFFGKDAHIEVPPLPPTITPERIEQWKQKHFELRYLPPFTLDEDDDYPGWKKKPTKGINLFDNLNHIKQVSQNQKNPHLANFALNQLPGCWMLIDTRPKPNYRDGLQLYDDDESIQTIIKQLVQNHIVNKDAEDGRRNLIHAKQFNYPEFWQPFYEHLGLSPDEAIIRLPRVIEQNMFGQEMEWDGTTTYEWAEEYYGANQRIVSGHAYDGGASTPGWHGHMSEYVGFRPVVVFSPS